MESKGGLEFAETLEVLAVFQSLGYENKIRALTYLRENEAFQEKPSSEEEAND